MEFIQSVFNNREIAIAFWVIIVVTILIFTKAGKDFLKSVTPILFCKKFVIFYFVFISFLCLVIYGLYKIEIWSLKLVKDTIFWVMFVELPLFAKTIEEAKDARFFRKLIKDNIAISVAVEFLIGFWTFDLWVEILLIPFLVFISALYAVAEREKKNKPAKSFLQGILTLLGVISFIYAIYNLVHFPQDFFSVDTLKVFVLPLILLILNLPVVYGLAIEVKSVWRDAEHKENLEEIREIEEKTRTRDKHYRFKRTDIVNCPLCDGFLVFRYKTWVKKELGNKKNTWNIALGCSNYPKTGCNAFIKPKKDGGQGFDDVEEIHIEDRMGWTMEERHVGTILDEYINLRKENERLKSSLQEERSKNQAKDKLILDLQKNNSYLRSDVDKANIRAHEAEKECKSFQRLLGKLYVKK